MSSSKKTDGKKGLANQSGLDDSALESIVGGTAAPNAAKIAEGFEQAAHAAAAAQSVAAAFDHAPSGVVTAHSSPIDTVAGSHPAAAAGVVTAHSSPVDTVAGSHPAAAAGVVPAHSSPVDAVAVQGLHFANAGVVDGGHTHLNSAPVTGSYGPVVGSHGTVVAAVADPHVQGLGVVAGHGPFAEVVARSGGPDHVHVTDHRPVDSWSAGIPAVAAVVGGGFSAAHGPAAVAVADPHGQGVDLVARSGGIDTIAGLNAFRAHEGLPPVAGPVATVHSAPIDHVSGDPAHTVSSGVTDALRSAEKAVENIFCHAAGTRIAMHDGTTKAVEQLILGDEVLLGGRVIGRGVVLADDLYDYRGTVVNGRHAVFEDGGWLRVEDSRLAARLESGPTLVYPVVTANHLLVCEQYICADVAEMDQDIGAVGRLAALNADTTRNRELNQAEDRYGFSFRLAA